MKKRTSWSKLAACFIALTLVLTFSVSSALAEDPVTDPVTDPTPVPFTTTGVVVAYSLPGVISCLPDDDTDEDDGATDPDDGTTDPDDGTDPIAEELTPTGPYITVANETGEYVYPVAEIFTITAPTAETGEYIVNIGDLAQVSGTDGVVDDIVITPAVVLPSGRSQYAAVPGIVEAIAVTDIAVRAKDGLVYTFVVTEATAVYAGPLTLAITDVSVGDRVVVKGDGAGGAKWVRFIGKSSETLRHRYAYGNGEGPLNGGANGALTQDGGKNSGNGNGRGNGGGNGRGRGPKD
jgi:hypothetical protein